MCYSLISLIYLLATSGILGIVIVSSASGFEILKEFIVTLVENFDIITKCDLFRRYWNLDRGRLYMVL